MDPQAHRGRRRTSIALAAIGALLVLLGGLLFYAGRAIFDSESFSQRAATALDDEGVRQPLAEAIVDGLIENAEPDLVNARPILVSVTSGLLETDAFSSILATAAKRAHRTVFTRDGANLVLNLADGTALAIDALKAVSPDLAKDVPPDATARLNELVESDLVLALAKAGEEVRFLGVVLPLVGLALLALAVGIVRDRRRGLMTASLSLAVAAGVGLAGLLALRAIVISSISGDASEAAAGVWAAYLGDLATSLLVALGAMVIVTAAVATRRRADAAEPLRRLATALGRTPSTPRAQTARALAALVFGIVVVLSPQAFLRVLTVAVGAYAIFFALTELLALLAPPPRDGEARGPSLRARLRPGRTLAALAVILGALVLLVVVLIGGEHRDRNVRAAESIERCNGFAELCDRSLDQVTFPSVHNAMSAAEAGFLTANNRKPIPDQLEAGVRGLLIDAHYGLEGKKGKVATDLEREGTTRAEIEEAVGEDFVETAERLTGRISGVDGKGKSQPYWCHVLCELGAIQLEDDLVRIREFLDTHPDEVVITFIEDYVSPADIEKGFVDSGLVEYAWEPTPGEPLPTLRELIATDKRLVVMAENEDGGKKIPWYLPGFDYAQETPFTFNSVEALKGSTSCDENRGEPGNPLFQLNHWVEKLPRSPKLAARVNDFDFLQARARRCERERRLRPNIVAVDFWEEGDLFEVSRSLNGLGRDAEPRYAETD